MKQHQCQNNNLEGPRYINLGVGGIRPILCYHLGRRAGGVFEGSWLVPLKNTSLSPLHTFQPREGLPGAPLNSGSPGHMPSVPNG